MSLPTTTTSQLPAAGGATGRKQLPGRAPAAFDAGGRGGMSLRQIWQIMQRHIWLIIVVFVSVMVISGALYVLALLFGKEYTARGMLVLTPEESIWSEREPTAQKFLIEARQKEQSLRLISPFYLGLLLQEPDVDSWVWTQAHPKEREKGELLDLLLENVEATPVRDSAAVAVTATDASPEAAEMIVNKLMEFYVQQVRADTLREVSDLKAALINERDRTGRVVRGLDEQIRALQASEDFESLDRGRVEVVEQVRQLNVMQINAKYAAIEAKRANDQIVQQYGGENPQPSPAMVQEVDNHPSVRYLEQRKEQLIEERQVMLDRLGPNHEVVKSLDIRIDEVDTNIRQKRNELLSKSIEQVVTAAANNLAAMEQRVKEIEADQKVARDRKRALDNQWNRYQGLLAERKTAEDDFQRVDQRIREVEVRINRGKPPVAIMGRATQPRPEDISFPRWEVFLAGGLVLGVLLGVGIAVLIEVADTSIRTPFDVSERTRMPLLGFIPLRDRREQPPAEMYRTSASDPTGIVAESFRQVRTNLLFAAPVDQLNSVAVTSSTRDEGKTAVACNLAITVALSGRKVLLVDTNFRRPAVSTNFAHNSTIGLSNVITNQATLAEAVTEGEVPNLSILPAGPTPPNPAELLGSATMRTLLDQAADAYDLVILDAPPALLVTDALVLATMVDGVIAVVRAGNVSRGMVGRLRDQLAKVNARIIGVVLNGALPTRGGYFRKSQQQYEEYQNQLTGTS